MCPGQLRKDQGTRAYIMNTFGETLTKIRKAQEMTQATLAKKMTECGFSTSANMVSKWEINYAVPSVLQFFTLCKILKIDDINAAFDVTANSDNPYSTLNEKGRARVKEYIQLLSKDKHFSSVIDN